VATVALAGHPPPLLISPDGSHTLLGEPCPPAGVTATLEPKDLSVELEPGDTLVLYTDGYMAAGETPMMTLSRLARGAENEQLETLLDHLLLDLASEIESFRDDVLLLALRVV
jgi:serine phosphatase RsbU (regulator of sigma subunit)